MPQRGGALNTHNIQFLDSFISDKGTRFLDPHILLQALRKPPYYTRLLHFKVSFNDLKEYTRLVKTQGLEAFKQKLAAASGAPPIVPSKPQPPNPVIVHNIIPRPPSPPGRLRKIASFLKNKIKKTFKKNSAPLLPPILVAPPAPPNITMAPLPSGHVAPPTSVRSKFSSSSTLSSHSPKTFRHIKGSKTRKHKRRGFAQLSSASDERERPLLSKRSSSSSVSTDVKGAVDFSYAIGTRERVLIIKNKGKELKLSVGDCIGFDNKSNKSINLGDDAIAMITKFKSSTLGSIPKPSSIEYRLWDSSTNDWCDIGKQEANTIQIGSFTIEGDWEWKTIRKMKRCPGKSMTAPPSPDISSRRTSSSSLRSRSRRTSSSSLRSRSRRISSSSPSPEPGTRVVGAPGVDAREVSRRLRHKSSESSLSGSEREARDSERLKEGAPALYALGKGARYVKEGTKKLAIKGAVLGLRGMAALSRKTGQFMNYAGPKVRSGLRSTRKKMGEKFGEGIRKFNTWQQERADAKRLEAFRRAVEPSSRSSLASSRSSSRSSRSRVATPPARPGFFSRIGEKFRGARVVPARGPVRRSTSSASRGSSASRHSVASRGSSASRHSVASRGSSASRHSVASRRSSASRASLPSPRTGIRALAHARGIIEVPPARQGVFSRIGAKFRSLRGVPGPVRVAAGIRGPGLLRRSISRSPSPAVSLARRRSSSSASASSRRSSLSGIRALVPASPKKGIRARIGDLFSRKKQATRKLGSSSSHSGRRGHGLLARRSPSSSRSSVHSVAAPESPKGIRKRLAMLGAKAFRKVSALAGKSGAMVAPGAVAMPVRSSSSASSPAISPAISLASLPASVAASLASSASSAAAAPVVLSVSPKHKWSSSSDGSPKAKPKIMFKIKSSGALVGGPGAGAVAKVAAVQSAPMIILESPKGIRELQDIKIGPAAAKVVPVILAPAVSPLSSPKGAKGAKVASAPMVVVASPKVAKGIRRLSDIKFGPAAAKAAAAGRVFLVPAVSPPSSPKARSSSPKAKEASVEPLPPGWQGYMHPDGHMFYGKPDEDMGMWRRPKDRPVVVTPQSELAELRKKHSGPKARVSAKLRARVAAAMGGPKSRKRSDALMDLEKNIESGLKRERKLERYRRLIQQGRRKEAIKYMRKHNMLHEVMDISHVNPVEDLELEVVDFDPFGSPPKKGSPLGLRKKIIQPAEVLDLEVVDFDPFGSPPKKGSPSGSRKRSSGKSSDSRSRKIGKSFGKMAELLEKEAAQDTLFKPAQFKEKLKPVAGIRGAAAGKKEDPVVDALHKKVVNRATSPTFNPHDPKKGAWA